ncbi:ParA family protein [Fusobacterium sp. IOR10]|uniref:ParA family protein n=1 Tax=Fusobacterium sp. IOR10 TaxID=2665157 RepID=UPI0013D4ECDA|nr:ParA family protein [Fusobacterium sp. IOR10]
MILIKNNKGGVGKSLITYWLAKGISELGYKTLILTSDNQNNILSYAGFEGEYGVGLEAWLSKGIGELIHLSKNLDYIPLTEYKLKRNFEEKFKNLIKELKTKYDYIFVDGSPTLGGDKVFIKTASQIIIPTYLDEITTEGIVNILNVVDDIKKIKSIIPNRCGKSKIEKEIFLELKEISDNAGILLTEPIKQSSIITNLIAKHKSIWDSKAKPTEYIRAELLKVIEVIINGNE